MGDASERKKLEEIDLSKLDIADLRNIKNTVLRDSIFDVLRRKFDLAASHQNHGSHSDHNTASSLRDIQFGRPSALGSSDPGFDPGPESNK